MLCSLTEGFPGDCRMTICIVPTIIDRRRKRRETVRFGRLGLCFCKATVFPCPYSIMSLSYSIPFPNVESYLRFCEAPDLDLLRPPSCEYCGCTTLHSHGCYVRNVWAEEKLWRIRVFRFRCANSDCKHTCSVLPSFVDRYERFTWDVQEVVCTKADEQSLEEAAKRLPAPVGPLCARTVWRWMKRWQEDMDKLDSQFWQYVISLHPTIRMPRGRNRPTQRLRYWQQIWMELSPSKVNVGLFHGLYRLRQSQSTSTA